MPLKKRLFDLLVTIFGLLILSPLLLLLGLLVWATDGTPIIFHQPRAGYKGKAFLVHKFRTMTNRVDPAGILLSDSERITRLGKFLRSSSLDELPELFNVLWGEMSCVGPRPLLVKYLEHYSPDQMRRHDVFPGITGWAQINGRNAISWEQKFKLDVWYVDNWSLGLDIKILLLTAWKILKREGINQPGHTTMEEFTGKG